MELFIMLVIGIFVVSYRQQNGENVYKFIANNIKNIYNKIKILKYKIEYLHYITFLICCNKITSIRIVKDQL